jgi:hypothetical protein
MRAREPETLLWVPLLPIFLVGAFPMLLFGILGFAGLVVLGVLLICAGLADALEANSQFNQEIIVHGYARRSERGIQASNLHSAVRAATIAKVSGIGLLLAGLFGLLA